ncbi:hypothetical protein HETIRDRAFT_165791 [Heterobasidion irregulare TC 32-1]|uniref:Uncharacterized protein n=1 Tax=Heterobasidion irregulare (strain TC 32-1) TaxID=747525 RepID=W4KCP1_HETIT|nr:uncharacterized protein HETIRDRAFT_165791 [Heterobasidion irregulare TC 32-1]ETW83509.1 hypothetical protein HETIRDRAFT_165791 [Heterobasidion irregulare TC 32-1]
MIEWGGVFKNEVPEHKHMFEVELQGDLKNFFKHWPQGFRWTCCGLALSTDATIMVPGASRAHAISAEWASLSRMRSSMRRILRIMVCSCVEDLTHVPAYIMLRSPLSVVKLVPCLARMCTR